MGHVVRAEGQRWMGKKGGEGTRASDDYPFEQCVVHALPIVAIKTMKKRRHRVEFRWDKSASARCVPIQRHGRREELNCPRSGKVLVHTSQTRMWADGGEYSQASSFHTFPSSPIVRTRLRGPLLGAECRGLRGV